MKSPVKQIVLKDLRRFWPLLMLWSMALGLWAGLPAWFEEESGSVREAGLPIGFLLLLVNVQLVVKVLAEDSPLKESAFWRTRPIEGSQMLRAKIIFLGGWTLLLPVLVAAASAWAYGFGLGAAARLCAVQIGFHGAVGLVFLLFSIFTRRVWSSVLVGWLVLTLLGVWLSVVHMRPAGLPVRSPNEEAWTEIAASLAVTRWYLAVGVVILGAGVAARLVYKDRRRAVAVATVCGALVVAAGVATSWPSDLLGWVPALQRIRPAAHGPERVAAERVDINSDAGLTVNGQRFGSVSATLRWTGLAEGEQCVPYRVEGVLKSADGREWTQALRVSPDGVQAGIPEALRALGADKFSDGGRVGQGTAVIKLAEAPEPEMASYRRAGTEWRGRVWARVGKVEPEWRMPFRSGARWAQGASRARIIETAKVAGGGGRAGGVLAVVSERAPVRPGWMLSGLGEEPLHGSGWWLQSYVLINAERGAFILASGGDGRSSSLGIFETSRRDANFLVPGAPPDVDWLEGAELVKLRFVETRRVVVELSTPVGLAPTR